MHHLIVRPHSLFLNEVGTDTSRNELPSQVTLTPTPVVTRTVSSRFSTVTSLLASTPGSPPPDAFPGVPARRKGGVMRTPFTLTRSR
ncbi:putative UDP-N-acetylglucosamine--peptide N-acetylglucosaminyltransferase SEC [Frankliniella fusca]|uniref:UDP-N-acetylglucosamine--peptide N-acetylglucosaminyltransferase SEC n=1 Tax=Frankliniella fusca TaxID=407009 RepID=A0AAE1HAI4_9NEOP|nr:putative UDP-N-acetylglucosamine--peptide N-acetylglucosaminyltransferase SEC [Frankliniella fusca]